METWKEKKVGISCDNKQTELLSTFIETSHIELKHSNCSNFFEKEQQSWS